VCGSEQNRSVANAQSDDLWPSRMHAATHILQEKTHACGVLKRHNFQVHVSLGSAETLVRRGGIVNHHSMAYSLSNISAKNYRNRLMWVESIVCNISVVFLGHSVQVYENRKTEKKEKTVIISRLIQDSCTSFLTVCHQHYSTVNTQNVTQTETPALTK